ncbi:MAG: AraC family transcriptional regulator [bacterium]|nr:AraC family transcriptional regulator [bacterium]
MLQHLQDLELDVEQILAESGFPPTFLEDATRRVRQSQIDSLWEKAIEASGDTLLALRVGMRSELTTLGIASYLVAASDSGCDAVERISSISDLYRTAARIEVSFETGLAALQLLHDSEYPPGRADSEFGIAQTVRLSSLLDVAGGPPVGARFQYSAAASVADYEAILGLPVRFDQPQNSVVFPLSTFESPFPKADAGLRTILEQHADALMREIPRENSFADRVQSAVARVLANGSPGVEDVATALGMSSRSLKRNLQAEGLTFSQILDDLRLGLALHLLEHDDRRIDEIAYRLGFSDASAFHKAFRRWTGKSPSEYNKT